MLRRYFTPWNAIPPVPLAPVHRGAGFYRQKTVALAARKNATAKAQTTQRSEKKEKCGACHPERSEGSGVRNQILHFVQDDTIAILLFIRSAFIRVHPRSSALIRG
jgi:hypothetical protein